MSRIEYMVKPDWISWDDVQNCQRKAHEATNNAHGFHMTVQDYTGDELRKSFGNNGYCFVALDGSKVVGVSGLRFFTGNRWWSYGKKVAYNCMDGILPEYQGTDVYFQLYDLRMKYIKESGADMIQSNTAENNKTVRKITKIRKFKDVQFSATGKGANYYSIIMVKWLHGCPYPDWFVKFMYNTSKILVKMIWKPGYTLRLFFWK